MDAETLNAINRKLANDDANRTFFKFVLTATEKKVRGIAALLDADEFDDDVIRLTAEQEMEAQGIIFDKPQIKEV